MKKVYISCYDNLDSKYKDLLIKTNTMRNNKIFSLVESNEELINNAFVDKDNVVNFVKKNMMKGADVTIFLVSEETKKRRISDWEARAAMTKYGIFDKCGIIIIYLPDLIEKYGSKIPRSVLPAILEKNINKKDVFMIETTWEKIKRDINIFDKLLNTAYAYSKMSNYELDDNITLENVSNFPVIK